MSIHKVSAFLVVAVGSMAAWDWSSVVSPHIAAVIVTGLGAVKLFSEFATGKDPA